MRCDQHRGLTEAAQTIVEGDRVTMRPSGQSYTGMFEDEYPLYEHVLPDGRVLREAVQAEPWSSGPVFFLALKDERGEWIPESLWPESEIERA